jgi:hypothetical protein
LPLIDASGRLHRVDLPAQAPFELFEVGGGECHERRRSLRSRRRPLRSPVPDSRRHTQAAINTPVNIVSTNLIPMKAA